MLLEEQMVLYLVIWSRFSLALHLPLKTLMLYWESEWIVTEELGGRELTILMIARISILLLEVPMNPLDALLISFPLTSKMIYAEPPGLMGLRLSQEPSLQAKYCVMSVNVDEDFLKV